MGEKVLTHELETNKLQCCV